MQKPTLVILAAGMGSRYGGMKQIDPVDEYGNLIIDYSIYDALHAGFRKIVFIIKRAIEKEFYEVIGNRIAKLAEVDYVFQELDKLPEGYVLPKTRVKPWGTAHALLCCKGVVNENFAVINADDFYGRDAFCTIYNFLVSSHKAGEYAMVGYPVEKTLTENGTVVRGVCERDENGYLVRIQEIAGIEPHQSGGVYTLNGDAHILKSGTPVSMNLWGFDPGIFDALSLDFPVFLDKELERNPEKCEYLLPSAVQDMLQAQKASVRVLKSEAQWFGVTYREDMPIARAAIRELKSKGEYPEKLWD